MGRKGQPVHGWIILDKPLGRTSAWAVGAVRRLLDANKAGHAGTLDPLASGVLPIALGEATKTVPFIQDGTKGYSFSVRWGEARDTLDAVGAITATSAARPTETALRAALPQFMGTLSQTPPSYSALKVAGQRAYDLARAGETPVLAPRTVRIDQLELVSARPDEASFRVECGKGTYVRVLAQDLALAVGTLGYVSALRRTRVGPFAEDRAISLEQLAELVVNPAPVAYLHPVAAALADIPAIAVTGAEARRLKAGQPIRLAPGNNQGQRGAVWAMVDGLPIAVAEVVDGEVRALRVFNL
ncbi:MAG: tRNA pseudouridine(55) synthase TruB [Alphaproteobacteria bacterium]|nr:tRNA pseudouridine(55) synthase TruB [Alphaproteobacteria bacterium]